MTFSYPPARRADIVDTHHGTDVADPYRWLEDPDTEETRAFVAAQNAVSQPYLAALPGRDRLAARMTELWDTPRTEPPVSRGRGAGRVTVWTHNDGLADQPVLWMRRAGDGDAGDDGDGDAGGHNRGRNDDTSPTRYPEPTILLDPNTMSDDGAVAVTAWALSTDGRLLAYTISESGSDRQRLAIRSTETGQDLDDRLDHLRFTGIAWYGAGFFYTRWPETEPGSTAPVRDPSIHYHRIGDDQSKDRLVFRNDDDPEPSYTAGLTEDDRFLILVEYLGTDRRNGLLHLDLETHGAAITAPGVTEPVDPQAWTRLAAPGEASHNVVHHRPGIDGTGSHLVVHTDRDAPNGKVVAIDLDRPDPEDWVTVVPEGPDPLEWAVAVAGDLVVGHLVEASHRLSRHSMAGEPRGELALPGPGSVTAITGRFDDPSGHLGFQSFVTPPTVLAARDGTTEVWAGAEAPIDPSGVIVERRHATSSDGKEVGMFVIRRADAALPGPVELYGYGGFSINLTPTYSPARLAFIEAGGIVVVANLRGGTERGEDWHTQGMLGNKQQVFDDFIACAEHLTAEGIATPDTLGIRGGSNGGLLTATVMIQRPDLFGAVVAQVPVTDMVRYQHFTAGRFWTAEYGDATDPDAFRWLMAYSPLHNVGDPAAYPPLLITTAESDDRVVPMHSHKLMAEIQYRAGGRSEQPLIERVETRAGHGLGKPTAKLIDEAADIYGFLLHHLRRQIGG